MGRPAVPQYLDKHVLQDGTLAACISPGQRFGLLFPFWREGDWSSDSQDKSKTNALKQVLPLSDDNRKLAEALSARQGHIAEHAGDDVVVFQAVSTSPFMTGIGNEHPLENGFSFLNPYGSPYLPGSAVKGILRRAAEELASGAFGGDEGWQYSDVWLLFGFDASSSYLRGETGPDRDRDVTELARRQKRAFEEWVDNETWDGESARFFMNQVLPRQSLDDCQSDPGGFLKNLAKPAAEAGGPGSLDVRELHFQGALTFWDVFPLPPSHGKESALMRIEILTPHYSDYYQKSQTPADCGQPVPNPFLTVAPGCGFTFHVQCETARLPEPLRKKWRPLIESAFRHAFDWLGFGAKTAVGYGQMETARRIQVPGQKATGDQTQPEPKATPISMSPVQKLLNELDLIKGTDMGRLGTIIQKIEALETQEDKKRIALAIRDKIGQKSFNKHKRKEYLQSLIDG